VDTFSHRRSTAIVPTTKDFEGLLEWRYADGDMDEKYNIFKTNLEGKRRTEKAREDLIWQGGYGVPVCHFGQEPMNLSARTDLLVH
jgi:hypothetical protein